MTDAEYQAARAAAIRPQSKVTKAAPVDKRPATDMTAEEWAAAHPTKKLATEMTPEEYAQHKSEVFRGSR